MASQKKLDRLYKDMRNAAIALSISGLGAKKVDKRTGVGMGLAEKLDANYDVGSFLKGSKSLAKEQYKPSFNILGLPGGRGPIWDESNKKEEIRRLQAKITQDFVNQYGSKDFISQLTIRRDRLLAPPDPRQASPASFPSISIPSISTASPLKPGPQGAGVTNPALVTAPTAPVAVEQEFAYRAPVDAARRGGVRRNKSSRSSRSSSATKNALAIGGFSAPGASAIGGRQLSL